MVLLPTYVCHDLLPERPHSNLLDVLRYNHHIFQGLLQPQLPFYRYLSGIRMVRSHHGRLQTDQCSVFPVKMADLYLPRVIVHPEGVEGLLPQVQQLGQLPDLLPLSTWISW